MGDNHSAPKPQNVAAKVAVGGMRIYNHVSPALKEFKWLNVKEKQTIDTYCCNARTSSVKTFTNK